MAPSTLKSQWWNWVARQKIDPHLPIHGLQGLVRHLGLRDLRGQAGAGVARALRPGDHAAALRAAHDGRAGEGGGRARRGDAGRAREAEEKGAEDALPVPDNVVALASRRR